MGLVCFPKLSSVIPLFAAASSTFAINHPIIQSRQAHVRRDLIDVCAYLDVDLGLNVDNLLNVFGHLDVCLCLSVLPAFVEANVACKAAVDVLGVVEVTAAVEALIKGIPGESCHYPTYSTPFCERGQVCGFNCTDGFIPYPPQNPTDCTCPPPNSVCNGKCGSFPNGCGSQTASRRRSTLPKCKSDETICGSPSGLGYDCVSTRTDKESCGGCVLSGPFGNAANGKDCTQIANQISTSCDFGVCKVEQCAEGFTVAKDGTSCIALASRDLLDVDAVVDAVAHVGDLVKADAHAAAAAAIVARDLVADTSAKINAAIAGLVGVLSDVDGGLVVERDIVADVVANVDADVGGLVEEVASIGAGLHVSREVVADVVAKVDATVDGLVGVDLGAIAGAVVA